MHCTEFEKCDLLGKETDGNEIRGNSENVGENQLTENVDMNVRMSTNCYNPFFTVLANLGEALLFYSRLYKSQAIQMCWILDIIAFKVWNCNCITLTCCLYAKQKLFTFCLYMPASFAHFCPHLPLAHMNRDSWSTTEVRGHRSTNNSVVAYGSLILDDFYKRSSDML